MGSMAPECIPLMISKKEREPNKSYYGRNESTDSLDYSQDGDDDEEECRVKDSTYHNESVAIHIKQETKEITNMSLGIHRCLLPRGTKIDWNAVQFAIRMAILLTISSLFVLIRTPNFHYPDAMWVLVSVLFVSWFPSLDAARCVLNLSV